MELFGQMVIQIILILRFQWLVSNADVKGLGSSFGVSFKTYVIATLTISFLGIFPAILKYHKRNRENLRPLSSISSVLIVLMWICVLLTKISVYVIGFQNTPGLFWVPAVTHIVTYFILLTKFEPQFKAMQHHEKLIHLLASFLVPISLPSHQSKSMAKVYGISLLLFFIECISILSYAVMLNNFSQTVGFSEANKEFPELINMASVVTVFDNLCYLTLLLVLISTLVSGALIVLYSKCFHPSNKLFKSKSYSAENKAFEMSTEE